MRHHASVSCIIATTAMLVLGACTVDGESVSVDSSTSSASAGGFELCSTVSTDLIELEQYSADEPVVKLPVPAGWERFTEMDSRLIRAGIVIKGLAADAFVPNVVVSVEDATGKVETPRALVEAQAASMATIGATATSPSFGTTCGYTSMTADVSLPAQGQILPRSGTMLAIAAESGGKLYGITLTAQTTDDSNADFKRDVDTIFEGVQVAASGAGT